jgi:hypothetical protein
MRWLGFVWIAALAAGCRDAGDATKTSGGDTGGGMPNVDTTEADVDTDADTDADTPPPEEEFDVLFSPPAQTDRYVFVQNPERDTVTRLEVATQRVDTVEVGARPVLVAASADYASAVVFNEDDDSVTLLDADTLAASTVGVRPNLNDLALSPDGAYALLWHNQDREDEQPAPDGLQSFNELSMVQLATAAHFPTAVGFNPRSVRFTPDGRIAVVVSDAYLATIDLTAPVPTPVLVELAPGVLQPPQAEEVIVSPDGTTAWVRQFGATDLLLVDLAARTVTAVPAGDNPTDLDLTPDGLQAVAVARGSHELWIYEVDDPLAPPTQVPLPDDVEYGSLLLDPSGALGVLYTTATPVERYAVWDRATNTVSERQLVKPVQSMAVSPTGETLLVVHTQTDGPDTEPIFAGS